MAPAEITAPSAARHLSRSEQADLVALGRSLPAGWVVTIEAPYGQLALTPAGAERRHVRCFIVDADRRVITRAPWLPVQ